MAFMDQMRDKLTQASQSTVQKAKGLSEIARLNGMISNAEKQINDLYAKIGYEVYCAYYDKPLPEAAELINQVTELHYIIENSRVQINAVNAVDLCPACGAKISKGMAFCGNCGHKLAVMEQPAEEVPAEPRPAFCANCGTPLSPDAMFCNSCGQKIE